MAHYSRGARRSSPLRHDTTLPHLAGVLLQPGLGRRLACARGGLCEWRTQAHRGHTEAGWRGEGPSPLGRRASSAGAHAEPAAATCRHGGAPRGAAGTAGDDGGASGGLSGPRHLRGRRRGRRRPPQFGCTGQRAPRPTLGLATGERRSSGPATDPPAVLQPPASFCARQLATVSAFLHHRFDEARKMYTREYCFLFPASKHSKLLPW